MTDLQEPVTEEARRPRSRLPVGTIVIGLVLIGIGALWLLDTTGVADLNAQAVLAGGVIAVGLGLMVGAASRASSVALIVVGIVLTGLTAMAGADGFDVGPSTTDADAFAVDGPVSRVIVQSDSGEVEAIAGQGSGVDVSADIRYRGREPELRHQLSGSVLTIEADCPAFGFGCRVDLRLVVPADADLTISTGSGSVIAERLDGAVDLQTGSGSVTMRDLSGVVNADTGSGRILGERLGSSEVRADTGSGSVELLFIVAPQHVDIDTGSGSVDLTVPAGTYNVETDSGSGSVSVNGIVDDPSASRLLRVDTGSGSIRINGS